MRATACTARSAVYAERCFDVATFSWRGVLKLFGDAAKTGKLRVPLAVVEGRATLAANKIAKAALRKLPAPFAYLDTHYQTRWRPGGHMPPGRSPMCATIVK